MSAISALHVRSSIYPGHKKKTGEFLKRKFVNNTASLYHNSGSNTCRWIMQNIVIWIGEAIGGQYIIFCTLRREVIDGQSSMFMYV